MEPRCKKAYARHKTTYARHKRTQADWQPIRLRPYVFINCTRSEREASSISLVRLYIDELTSLFSGREHYYTVNEGEERVVASHADIEARMVLRTALTLDDVAGAAFGTSEYFHTESCGLWLTARLFKDDTLIN